MPWYFLNNKNYFKINLVDLPKNLIRSYRLTLDYKEDLLMFNNLAKKQKKNFSFINKRNLKILDKNKKISKINAKFKLIYLTKNFQNKLKK